MDFDIPDAWWHEAEMTSFRPQSSGYLALPNEEFQVQLVPIEQVDPPLRDPGVTWFHRDRMVTILRGFRSNARLPAIVAHCPPGANKFPFAVRDGLHRFYASVAIGFTHVPLSIRPYFDICDL